MSVKVAWSVEEWKSEWKKNDTGNESYDASCRKVFQKYKRSNKGDMSHKHTRELCRSGGRSVELIG